MAIDEAARHRLHTRLEGVLGAEPASDLMSLLDPAGWADIAALKQDVAGLKVDVGVLRQDVASVKQDLPVLEQALRLEMSVLRTELRGDFTAGLTGLDAKIDREVGVVRLELSDFRAEMHDALRKQTISLVGVMATFSGIIWATVTFLPT